VCSCTCYYIPGVFCVALFVWMMVIQAEKAYQVADTKLALEVVVKKDKASVTEALAQLLVAYATHTLVVKGSFVFAVSGDGPLLALMADLPPLLVGKVDWSQVCALLLARVHMSHALIQCCYRSEILRAIL